MGRWFPVSLVLTISYFSVQTQGGSCGHLTTAGREIFLPSHSLQMGGFWHRLMTRKVVSSRRQRQSVYGKSALRG
ncbi:hypothetical protein BJX96DRAFT_149932 [Aspergillus floccosus]